MTKAFSLNVSGHSDEIRTVLVPLNLRNEHCSLLIGTRYMDLDGNEVEELTMYSRDILRFTCPLSVLKLFKKAFDYSILYENVKLSFPGRMLHWISTITTVEQKVTAVDAM